MPRFGLWDLSGVAVRPSRLVDQAATCEIAVATAVGVNTAGVGSGTAPVTADIAIATAVGVDPGGVGAGTARGADVVDLVTALPRAGIAPGHAGARVAGLRTVAEEAVVAVGVHDAFRTVGRLRRTR